MCVVRMTKETNIYLMEIYENVIVHASDKLYLYFFWNNLKKKKSRLSYQSLKYPNNDSCNCVVSWSWLDTCCPTKLHWHSTPHLYRVENIKPKACRLS